MNPVDTDIKKIVLRIEKAIHELVSSHIREKYWVTHYGAIDIHPKHLVYWICVQSDSEKRRLKGDTVLMRQLRDVLVVYYYPSSGRDEVYIGFESQETVDREAGGNWWNHWK